MTKAEFERIVAKAKAETHDALALVWNDLNQGQRKKLLKNPEVEAVFKRYGVID